MSTNTFRGPSGTTPTPALRSAERRKVALWWDRALIPNDPGIQARFSTALADFRTAQARERQHSTVAPSAQEAS